MCIEEPYMVGEEKVIGTKVERAYAWAENIHKDMQQINNGLKDYKYLSDHPRDNQNLL